MRSRSPPRSGGLLQLDGRTHRVSCPGLNLKKLVNCWKLWGFQVFLSSGATSPISVGFSLPPLLANFFQTTSVFFGRKSWSNSTDQNHIGQIAGFRDVQGPVNRDPQTQFQTFKRRKWCARGLPEILSTAKILCTTWLALGRYFSSSSALWSCKFKDIPLEESSSIDLYQIECRSDDGIMLLSFCWYWWWWQIYQLLYEIGFSGR